ncbi:hypothetical protein KY084_03255 [Stakelama sp. CBK3Z-3]|uniref:UTP--glucose-1-phosphate uridylyltransferase n=1 Tax=Stakelama flava TaxID=2860338 RepID=A0ABS6XI80_9SPHN|nr:hypothetical protein [Stakelama flava]
MTILNDQDKGAGGEIQLTDAMAKMIDKQPFHGFTFDGERFDCGDKTGFIMANFSLGLDDDAIGEGLRAFAHVLLHRSGSRKIANPPEAAGVAEPRHP